MYYNIMVYSVHVTRVILVTVSSIFKNNAPLGYLQSCAIYTPHGVNLICTHGRRMGVA